MRIVGIAVSILFFPLALFAADDAVSFATNPLWLSRTHVTQGNTVRVSTVVMKSDDAPVSGTVTFYAGTTAIGSSDFSLPAMVGGAVVAVSWVPTPGSHIISAEITNAKVTRLGIAEDITVAGELKSNETLVVDPDNDGDGVSDDADADDDNDSLTDAAEISAGTDPRVKNVTARPEVAGAATTTKNALGEVGEIAKSTGSLLFAKTEGFRLSVADYFDTKLSEAEAVRAAKQAAADDVVELDERLVAEPRPLTDQLKDTSGLLEGLKIQIYKIFSFIFENVYAFYLVILLFILWVLRKIWRRYSLD